MSINEIRPYRVLVVDDLDHARLAIKTAIGDAVPSCEFVEAENATKAEEVLKREEPFDLAVIDLKLEEPDKDGITLVKVMKGVFYSRIIIYTGYPTVETACAAYEAGADSYISKLYSDATEKLKNKAKVLLTQRDLRARLQRQSQAHREAQKAFEENKQDWTKKYAGQFVIVQKGKVVEHAKDPFGAWNLLDKYTPDERCDLAVLEIPSHGGKNA